MATSCSNRVASSTWSPLAAVFCLALSSCLLPAVSAMVLYPEGRECLTQYFEGQDFITGHFVVMYSGEEWNGEASEINFWVDGPTGRMHDSQHKSEESFQFYAAYAGDYKFCFETRGQHVVATVDFDFYVGHVADHTEALKDEHVNDVKDKVAEIHRSLALVQNDQDYFKAREQRRRKTNESTRRRVMWYALLECLVLVLASAAQVLILRHFFEKRGKKKARSPWQ